MDYKILTKLHILAHRYKFAVRARKQNQITCYAMLYFMALMHSIGCHHKRRHNEDQRDHRQHNCSCPRRKSQSQSQSTDPVGSGQRRTARDFHSLGREEFISAPIVDQVSNHRGRDQASSEKVTTHVEICVEFIEKLSFTLQDCVGTFL